MLQQNEIHRFLAEAGIRPDGTVLIHTSMKALGEVEGGCDGLIDAFTSYLREGLFLIPTHTWATVTPENPVYDVRRSIPCIGALPTVAAFRKDGVRSLHPTHSVAAFGKRAKEFVDGEEAATSPCSPGGVWQRLYDEGATILLIGVGLNRNTYIHAVDEMLDLPGRLSEPFQVTVIDGEGRTHKTEFRHHTNTGSENFGNFETPLVQLGALQFRTLGNAKTGIFDVRKGTEILKTVLTRAEYHLCETSGEIPEEYYL